MDSSSKRSHRSKRANGVYVEDEVDVEQNASKRSKTGARLSSSLRHLLLRVLVTLMKHPSAVPFNFPVDTVQVPDYLTVIKRPMDFSTIQVSPTANLQLKLFSSIESIRSGCICNTRRICNRRSSSVYQLLDIQPTRFIPLQQCHHTIIHF